MTFWDSPLTFWNSQLPGVITGAIIAGGFAIIVQLFANHRQNKQLAHDLEIRQKQFAHEREQDNRGRRTAALVDLQGLLEEQASALQDLWGFMCNPAPHHRPDPDIAVKEAEEARDVLLKSNYRKIVWPINDPETEALHEYADKVRKLLAFVRQQEEIGTLRASDIPVLNEELRATVGQDFKAVAELLSSALKQISNLTSELNDVQVRKAT